MKLFLRLLMGSFLVFAGVSHLTFARAEFLAQVPVWQPLDPDFVVVASGIVEILLGLSFLFLTKYKIYVGIVGALFFIAIFPGNINQYVYRIDAFGLNSDTSRLIRLFFQPVLVAWALWCTDAWVFLKAKFQK
ncbi:hypothetical protein AZI86_02220 [Bdellovibrio bacteriovorus]|uniref:DoxX family membrane protein n=1 Tax=Bdellovibrio bacteriovorus TaxID=959 RepID=A0A150WN72_BDEBC|nr:DoxX family membrane protein [Bdellovibrio bacteriovorus]KYG65912.1 hypothetical protein AZI86_02220 [Bdellovibrio bacteriovorus]